MITRLSVSVLASGLLLQGAAVWTATPAATAQQSPGVTFHKDVAPIMQKNCESCHRAGQVGPFSTQTYKDVRPWAKAIKAAVVARKMPPWNANPEYGHFINDRSLKQADVDTITAWVDGGAPEGNPKDAPPPREWPAGGWQHIKPDVVLDTPAYTVPATGVMEWIRVAFPAPFKEDVWMTAWEVVPGAPEVVHHYCFGFKKSTGDTPYGEYQWMEVPRDEEGITLNRKEILSGERDNTGAKFGTVASHKVGSKEVTRRQGQQFPEGRPKLCYLPGQGYEDYRPVEAGIFVPAGSEITLNLHYTTNGLETIDRTKVGFVVQKERPKYKLFNRGGEGAERDETGAEELKIPPGEGGYKPPAFVTYFPRDTEIAYFRPHAHARGKHVRETLVYPDGRQEIVLDVKYDFNWQLSYWTSIKVPKGSKMITEWTYDNSPGNRYNPNPNSWVYWGQQSWEEMGGAGFGGLIPSDADESQYVAQSRDGVNQ